MGHYLSPEDNQPSVLRWNLKIKLDEKYQISISGTFIFISHSYCNILGLPINLIAKSSESNKKIKDTRARTEKRSCVRNAAILTVLQ